MVARIARLHHQPASLAGMVRTAAGWAIALAGLVLLASQLSEAVLGSHWRAALVGGAMAAFATALGAFPVLVIRRIGDGAQGMLLGFGAGVMLAAAVFSLLLPAFAAAQALGATATDAAITAGLGLAIGAVLLLAMDRALPHTHRPGPARSNAAVWLFVFAIAVHNIPEGLAIGVAASGDGGGNAVATGISLQNVPEGLVVAIALVAAGYARLFAFAIAAVSGLVEPIASVAGATMIGVSELVLPWALAGAAGAMLFVVSHEIIPESHRRGHETLATGGLISGFIIMMMLDTLL